MTKAEVIRKLAKRAGVSHLNAKIFFEIFLRKLSLQLNPGETIKINNYGYFQMRTGKISKISADDTESVLADVIIFSPGIKQGSLEENLIFNIPNKKEDEYNLVDAYFSLSFGKPVIPLKDTNIDEYFVPPSGNELKRLFDTKVDKILKEVELVGNLRNGNEILLINPDSISPAQIEIIWGSEISGFDSFATSEDIKVNDTTVEADDNSWDIQPEVIKEIKEAALLDTENEDSSSIQSEFPENISWDFGDREVDGDIKSRIHIQDESFTEQEEPSNFRRIRSVSDKFYYGKEVNIHDQQEDNTAGIHGHIDSSEDSDLLQSINDEINEEGFAEVKGILNKNDNKLFNDKVQDDELEYSNININHEVEPDNDSSNKDIQISSTLVNNYEKKRGVGIYIAFISLFIIGGSILVYFRYLSGNGNVKHNKVDVISRDRTVSGNIINRKYDIPINYTNQRDPSLKSALDPVDRNAFDINIDKVDEKSNLDDTALSRFKTTEPKEFIESNQEKVKSVPIKGKEFIYKSGNKYIVQVSSWSSFKNASKHAAIFKEKGYQPEIVKVKLDKGIWYRVRIGYFNTEAEAVKFYNTTR
jgi:hypothetical protein